jgi:dTDP-4-amino-4,6-dideoxygalactose transaminase
VSVKIPFLSMQPGADAAAVRAAIDRVLDSGWFVLGPEVEHFEREFATSSGAAHAVGVGTGTDAIALILRGLDIGPGDEVITTPLSAAYTALAIQMAGATPVFADIDPVRLTLAPAAVESVLTAKTRAILPVHLYGQAADMTSLMAIASRHRLAVVEDCCQAHLARSEGRPVGTIGNAGAFSFYPTKNLGALGDGGAIVTNDAALAARLRRLRNGGQTRQYAHVEFGVNSRLDELQAAILRARLPFLGEWTAARRRLAAAYRRLLAEAPLAVPPECDPGHVYHLFVVLAGDDAEARNRLRRHLSEHGIDTLVHYPVTIPSQPAFAALAAAACPAAERVCRQVVSLPLYPGLGEAAVDDIAAAIRRFS